MTNRNNNLHNNDPLLKRTCVTDSQCLLGDLCFNGVCIPYFQAQEKIIQKINEHK